LCISPFAPNKSIQVKYASESIWLARVTGHPEIVVDLLIKNISKENISELNCIVPQRLFNKDGSIPVPCPVYDITEDMADENSKYSRGHVYNVRESQGSTYLDLTLPHPSIGDRDITYSGTFRGNNRVAMVPLSPRECAQLSIFLTGIFKVILGTPIRSGESRWLRWRICPFTGPQEHRELSSRLWCYFRNDLTMTYNVSGPAKVPFDLIKKIETVLFELERGSSNASALRGDAIEVLNSLREKIIVNGIHTPDIRVEIEDWRTRFFRSPMEPFSNMQKSGAVRIAGAQPNYFLPDKRSPNAEEYYEWASGSNQIDELNAGEAYGKFNISFTTKYIPLIHRIGPILALIAIILSSLSLILRFFMR
jgi:hypothetical protein